MIRKKYLNILNYKFAWFLVIPSIFQNPEYIQNNIGIKNIYVSVPEPSANT